MSSSSSSTKDLQVSFDPVIINSLCKEIAQSLSVNKRYPAKIREEIKAWVPNFQRNLLQIWMKSANVCPRQDPMQKKFIPCFMVLLELIPQLIFLGFLPRLLQCLQQNCQYPAMSWIPKMKQRVVQSKLQLQSFSDKEISGLQYLGSYVFHSLHKILRRS